MAQKMKRTRDYPLVELRGRSFCTTGEFTREELSELLDLAMKFKTVGHAQPLAGRSVALVFFNPSLRTRTSMEIGVSQLGGHPVSLEVGSGTWSLEWREGAIMNQDKTEHVKDAVQVLSRYVDAIAVRCFPGMRDWNEDKTDPILAEFRKYSRVPIVNMESALWHPCQALADVLTMHQALGSLDKRKVTLAWVNHPKPLPHAVPNSFALACAQFGIDLTIACPPEYQLSDEIMAQLEAKSSDAGGAVRVVNDLNEGFAEAEIVYAKSWAGLPFYGDAAKDQAGRQPYQNWIIDSERMALTSKGRFMHCLPVRRNVEVTDEVIDSANSLVYDEAENRLHVQKAILASIL
ncbi:MAG TPA: N-acetylornithine carbamoyltransferase [Blastocatellia bacterium]|nr:N-acetylornithine carbamoyltransferase [Blastocatellia bacterium]